MAKRRILAEELGVTDTPMNRTTILAWAVTNVPAYVTFAGSIRRQKKQVNDIDILVPHAKFDDVIRDLKIRVYARGEKEASGFVRVGKRYIQIDIRTYTQQTYPYMLLYFTGSKSFNISMRIHAKSKGWLLNQYGLWKSPTKRVNATTELDIFRALGLPYTRTEDR